jgi:hypothetical protein
MPVAKEDFLYGQGVFVKGQKIGDERISPARVKEEIASFGLHIGGEPVFPDPSFDGDRIFTDDGDSALHNQ